MLVNDSRSLMSLIIEDRQFEGIKSSAKRVKKAASKRKCASFKAVDSM